MSFIFRNFCGPTDEVIGGVNKVSERGEQIMNNTQKSLSTISAGNGLAASERLKSNCRIPRKSNSIPPLY
jgi:hypothetical protein